MPTSIPQERSSERTAQQVDVVTPQAVGDIGEVVQSTLLERFSMEAVAFLAPQINQEIQAIQLFPQERVQQRTVEPLIALHAAGHGGNQRSGPEFLPRG